MGRGLAAFVTMSEAQGFVKALLSRPKGRAGHRDKEKKGGNVEPLFDKPGSAAKVRIALAAVEKPKRKKTKTCEKNQFVA
jgi:hypothetical protein